MQLTHSGHGVYFAEFHVCWCTKYRRRILNPGVAAYLRKILAHIVRGMTGVKILEIGIDPEMRDHIHLVIHIPPRYVVSDVIATLKAKSASLLRKSFPWLEKVYWLENVVWSPGFFLSTVGINTEIIKNYVRWQGRQDSDQAQLNLLDSASL
ncbi:IS200/IS605 family transposase [Candidatus Peregrinibacteria bacterium]|nr:IS200/IS605 family transposase [Candidatus Peregrinibacteria bacterium]